MPQKSNKTGLPIVSSAESKQDIDHQWIVSVLASQIVGFTIGFSYPGQKDSN